ncbi:ParA family protein [Streptomyces sp. cg40]|uniref:ParA family protein n=1 Tax=Streptomyces sp. cg40 TaxID=3419764 RepID=UPI003D012BB0
MDKKARVISVAIRKGGAGKTTTSTNLAAALMRLNQRVLLVDADSQGNASKGLGINREASKWTLLEILEGKVEDPRAAIVTKEWTDHAPGLTLDVIPSHDELDAAGLDMAVKTALAQMGMSRRPSGNVHSIRALVQKLGDSYDYIIIDTAPDEGLITLAALAATNDVVIPYEAGAYNLDGLINAFKTIRKVQVESNPELTIHGILLTKTDSTMFTKQVAEDLIPYADHIYPFRIPRRTWYNWTNEFGQPGVLSRPTEDGSQSYMKLAEMLVNE